MGGGAPCPSYDTMTEEKDIYRLVLPVRQGNRIVIPSYLRFPEGVRVKASIRLHGSGEVWFQQICRVLRYGKGSTGIYVQKPYGDKVIPGDLMDLELEVLDGEIKRGSD